MPRQQLLEEFDNAWMLDPSLSLYLPLYQLQGSSTIQSKDAIGHTVTVNGPTYSAQGRVFDGIDDYLSVANHPRIHLVRNYTWLIWVKQTSLAASEVLISDRLDPNSICYQLYINITTGLLDLYAKTGAGAISQVAISSTVAVPLNQWALMSITRTATSVIFGKNNIFETIPIVNDVGEAPTQPVVFGVTYANGTDNWWPGTIGEIMLWSRALTSAEIQNVYEATRGRYQ